MSAAILTELNAIDAELRTLHELPELSDEQAKRADELMARQDTLHAERTSQEAAARKQALAERVQHRTGSLIKPAPVTPARKYETPKHRGKIQYYQDADDAYDVGLYLRAHLFGDKRSREILEHRGPEWYDGARGIIAETRTQTEGTNTAGGHLVPDPLSAAIWVCLEAVGVAVNVCDVVPMTADTLGWPKQGSGPTVYYPGEATAITASDSAFSKINLTAVKRAVMTKYSTELAEDGAINIAQRVAEMTGHSLAYQMDNEFINGDGTATYGGETGIITGLSSVTGAQATGTGNLFSELTLADFNATAALLPDRYWVDGELAWIMRRQYYAASAERVMYAAGGNTVGNIEGGVRPMLLGYPVYFTSRMPAQANSACAALFGNFKKSVMVGRRREVRVDMSEHYAFNEDVITTRATSRYDINFHETGSGSTAGGVVELLLAGS